MKVLGVDIGSYSVKVAELDSTSRGFTFTQFHEFPLSQDPTRDRGLQRIEILRDFSARFDPQNTKWVIGVPQTRASVHHKRFPFRERSKILKTLAFEMEDEIPLDIDQTIFDLKLVEFLGPQVEVLTVACPKEAVEEALDLARDGGFDPEIISVEGLALANLFENWNAPPPEVPPSARGLEETAIVPLPLSAGRLILHMGHSRSILLVYRDNSLVAVRSLLWGGHEIAQALATGFGLPIFEAAKALEEKAFILMNSAGASRDQIKLSEIVSNSVDVLLRELRLTILDLRATFALEFRSIELLGGVSQIQNLGPYMTQGLELPANLAPQVLEAQNPRFPITPQINASGVIAVGLAIEGLKRPRNPAINLRKEEFARENATLKLFWERWRVVAQVAMAAFAIFFVYSVVRDQMTSWMNTTIEEKLVDAAAKTAGLRNSNETRISSHIRGQQAQIRTREAFSNLDTFTSALDVINKLSEKMPIDRTPGRGYDIRFLGVNNDDAVIDGVALSPDMIPKIESALRSVARANSVQKIDPEGPANGGGSPFAYKFKVNRKL